MNLFKKLSVIGVALSLVLSIAITGTIASNGRFRASSDVDSSVRAERMVVAKGIQSEFEQLALMLYYQEDDTNYLSAYMRSADEQLNSFLQTYENRLNDEVSRVEYAALKEYQSTASSLQDGYLNGEPEASEELSVLYDNISAVLNELVEMDLAMREADGAQVSSNAMNSQLLSIILCVLLTILQFFTMVMVILTKPKKTQAELPNGRVY